MYGSIALTLCALIIAVGAIVYLGKKLGQDYKEPKTA